MATLYGIGVRPLCLSSMWFLPASRCWSKPAEHQRVAIVAVVLAGGDVLAVEDQGHPPPVRSRA